MRNYLEESQAALGSPRPLADLLSADRAALLRALVKFLSNSDIYKRKYAAFCLGQIGDTSILPALKTAFDREEEGGAKDAMRASLACLNKMPATSGSTETQRCQYVEEVYKNNLPEEIKNFWKEGGIGQTAAQLESGRSKPPAGTPTAAKVSSGGCITLVVAVVSLAGIVITRVMLS